MLVVGHLEEMHRSTGQTSPVLCHFFCYQLHPVEEYAEYQVKLGHRVLFSTNWSAVAFLKAIEEQIPLSLKH